MRVHGIKTRKYKINPNLTCERQTKKKWNKDSKLHTHTCTHARMHTHIYIKGSKTEALHVK